MSLDYEFVPVDVDIISHPKAFAAGVEAMGLWLWSIAHSKLHRTSGRVSRIAAFAAWGGRRNAVLAKRLVDAGLWILREDGDWDVWNHEKKAPVLKLTPGAKRTQKWRETKRVTSPVTNGDRHGDVTCDVSASYSTSTSVSSGSQIASPPAWWQSTLDTLEANTGVKLAAGEAWLRYAGHRASKEPPKPTSPPDALHWLGTVMVAEHRKARDEAYHREKRDADFDSRRRVAREGPPKPPPPTKAQADAFAEELATRVRAARLAAGGDR